jgi:hypothetical protein
MAAHDEPILSGPIAIKRLYASPDRVYYAIRPDIWRNFYSVLKDEELTTWMLGAGYAPGSKIIAPDAARIYKGILEKNFGEEGSIVWHHTRSPRQLLESTHMRSGLGLTLSDGGYHLDKMQNAVDRRKYKTYGILEVSFMSPLGARRIADRDDALRNAMGSIIETADALVHERAYARRAPLIQAYATARRSRTRRMGRMRGGAKSRSRRAKSERACNERNKGKYATKECNL